MASGAVLQSKGSQIARQLSDTAPQSASDPAPTSDSQHSPEPRSHHIVQHEQKIEQDGNDLSHPEPEQQQQQDAVCPPVLNKSAEIDSPQDTQQQLLLAQPDRDDNLHSNIDRASSDDTHAASPMVHDMTEATALAGPSASAPASEAEIAQRATQQAPSDVVEDATGADVKAEKAASIAASDTGQHEQPLMEADAHQTEIATENGDAPAEEDSLPEHVNESQLDAEQHDKTPQPNRSTNGLNLVAHGTQEHERDAALPQALQG